LHFQCFGYDELTVKKATQRKNFSQVHLWERNDTQRRSEYARHSCKNARDQSTVQDPTRPDPT
jgi:hypothetical protein